VTEPEWVTFEVVLAIHEAQIAEHGGSDGIRDHHLLDSAVARPRQFYAYSDNASLYQLAAAYALGMVKNHAFVDGNKRTAWVVCAVFLELNGITVIADQSAVVAVMMGAADGTVTQEMLSAWLEQPDVTRSKGV
jgi:death on curing protein